MCSARTVMIRDGNSPPEKGEFWTPINHEKVTRKGNGDHT